jgi:hypothetical protein
MKTKAQRVSFLQLFMIGFLFLFMLRLVFGLLWMLITSFQPSSGQAQAFENFTDIIPLPLLIVLIPFLLAAIILFLIRPKRLTSYTQQYSENASTDQTEDKLIPELFNPYFSKEKVLHLLKIIALIWGVIFLTQLMSWFAFRSYSS